MRIHVVDFRKAHFGESISVMDDVVDCEACAGRENENMFVSQVTSSCESVAVAVRER